MTRNDPALLAFLEEQRAEYTRSLPRRLEQIASLWQQILKGESLGEALPAFERHAHSIAGSAATFGWADLGLAGADMGFDGELQHLRRQPLAPQVQAQVGLAVEELQRRFQSAA